MPRPVHFFRTGAGRCPALEFLEGLAAKDRAAIHEDLRRVAEMGRSATASVKPIRGADVHGLMEVRTRNFRTFWCHFGGALCVLHVCGKGDQEAGIAVARTRMALLEEGG